MALLDFLKQKEIAEINRLNKEIASLNLSIQTLENRVGGLQKDISQLEKYQKVVDVDKLIEEKLEDLELQKQNALRYREEIENETLVLKRDYTSALSVYKNLKHQTDLFSESLELSEYGVYEPHFDFETSEIYKGEIGNIRDRQKEMISNGTAIGGGDQISWNGSLAKGQAMVKREKKLMMRAFSGECDSFISSVEWNNAKRMEERIYKSHEAINQVYKEQGIYITAKYCDLKIDELRLAYEYKKKKFDEKEEQRQIREQMREEEKAAREIEAALAKAEKDEESFHKAIEKTKKEAEVSDGTEREKLMNKIIDLERKLVEVEEKKARALSMAQQTRRGHVYVISNIGSFGENIYKIGMTRRLDPQDRIRELGDASVPFQFDIHAMIYSEDAPALETLLHKAFDKKKVNMVNYRREFFSVTLDEIEDVIKHQNINAELVRLPEAMEYHESIAILEKIKHFPSMHPEDAILCEFPESI